MISKDRWCYYRDPMTKTDTITRQFFLGFVKIHILHHAAEERVYGLALIDELARHGYRLSPGTLYPVLHALEAGGYLAGERRTVAGKVRKYYAITPVGRRALREARLRIAELTDEVMGGREVTQPRKWRGMP
jgi:DNA-binding PadR family transcriptional regulator